MSHILTIDQVWECATKAGFTGWDRQKAVLIAYAESRFHADQVTHEPHGSPSYGLWQIHASDWTQFDRDRLLDPAYNAKCAHTVFHSVGWRAWSTFHPTDENYYEKFHQQFEKDLLRLQGDLKP